MSPSARVTKTRGAARSASRLRLSVGPWKGVRDTVDPYDDAAFLTDAFNAYLPDPAGQSGWYIRPGLTVLHNETGIVTGVGLYGQCVHAHVAVDGSVTNLAVIAGKIYRVTTVTVPFDTWTEVTPVGMPIQNTQQTVKMLSTGGNLIVSDGVNRPWLATNLAATPITGTVIAYNAANDPWAATDITEYGGSVFYALDNVAGVKRRFDISWTEPGLPDTGLQQTGFDNNWTLIQQSDEPLTAICGTNVSLFYFRRASVGRITGMVGPNLASTATHDAAAYNIGTLTRDSIQLFGDTIYFTDAVGRPNSLAIYGSAPNPLWHQLRGKVDATVSTVNEALTSRITRSAIEPVRNLYLVGVWTNDPSHIASPDEMLVFDAATGAYFGAWRGDVVGFGGSALGHFINPNGARQFVALGSAVNPGDFVFATALRTTDDPNVYYDGPVGDNITVQFLFKTGRIGYDPDRIFQSDMMSVVLGAFGFVPNVLFVWVDADDFAISVAPIQTFASADSMTRYVAGINAQGKGVQLYVQGNAPTNHPMSLQSVSVVGVMIPAASEDV